MKPLRLLSILAFACIFGAAVPVRAEELRIATLAPRDSIWGKIFSVWAGAVSQKTNGKLTIRVDWNGTQGDEQAMVGKLKAGQLDGVTCSSLGLAQIHKPILALQMPGVFDSWEALDRGREALRPEFEKAAEAAGFVISGWGDLGGLRGMGRGVAIRVPEDLRGHRPMMFRTDSIGPTLFSMIDGVTGVPLSAPEVLPALRTKSIDVLSAPSLVAEQLQWSPLLPHISSESSVFAIGGMVWSKRRLDQLPPDLRQILRDTGAKASAALSARVRAEDDAAYSRLAGKMFVIKLEAAEKKRWVDLFAKVRARLAQGAFSPGLVKRVEKLGSK